ncbi:unnamed protein product, partial [Scytosiphon promiscuus]
FEQILLHKIHILAEHHARNVGTLRRLRHAASTPKIAWEVPTDSPRTCEARSAVTTTTRYPSKKGNFKLSCTQPANHALATPSCFFTRVTSSNSKRDGPVPTLVEPFRSMETQTAAWRRKIREREELELQTKRDEERARTRDRARYRSAINVQKAFVGVIARSNEMMERRRTLQREAEQNEKEDRECNAFKARPLHITDEDWQTIQGRQTLRRKHRVQLRKEMISSLSKLPRRMAMHALKERERAHVATGTAGKSSEGERRTGLPSLPPENIRLILSRRQQRWDAQLAAAKKLKRPTIPQVLPMEEREKVSKQRAQARKECEQAQSLSACDGRGRNETWRRESRTLFATPIVPRTTSNFQMKLAYVQARQERERNDLERKIRKETARHVQEQVTSKRLAKVLAQLDRQQGRLARRNPAREGRRKTRESRERYRKVLTENRKKLEQATQDAPTLWERHGAEMRKETTKRIALCQVARRIRGTGGGHWLGKMAAEKVFDEEEERVILGLPT